MYNVCVDWYEINGYKSDKTHRNILKLLCSKCLTIFRDDKLNCRFDMIKQNSIIKKDCTHQTDLIVISHDPMTTRWSLWYI
jgi:hypothetical protein